MTRERVADILRREMPYLQHRFGIRKIAIYGSFAKGKQTTRSDIDILVDLSRPLGLEFVGLACYLEEILGRKVDLATFSSLDHALQEPGREDLALDIKKTLTYV